MAFSGGFAAPDEEVLKATPPRAKGGAPRTLGQTLVFAIEKDPDQRFADWVWIHAPKGWTVMKLAAKRGHPEDARVIADENGIRSVYSKFGKAHRLKVPGEMVASASFEVLAGDTPPRIVGGYAKFDKLDRPQRVGLTTFLGYDPITMEVAIRFEAIRGSRRGEGVEDDCALLERMAGRGNFEGAAVGPPPVVRIGTFDSDGKVVPLIPANYQASRQNATAPLWRVADIAWDESPLRNGGGNRIRQLATVTVQQHTPVSLPTRSAAKRSKSKKKKHKK
jgi:hypothetical protein